jgi:EF hand
MKSNLQSSLSLFIIVLILTENCFITMKVENLLQTKFGITLEAMEGSNLTQGELAKFWTDLFTGSRQNTCAAANARKKAIAALAAEGKVPGVKGKKGMKAKFAWIKNWGYNDSAYFFDFLDPVFQKEIVDYFEKVYEALRSIDNKDTAEYKDLFDINKLINHEEKNKKTDVKELNKNYNPAIYEISINTVQLNKAMKDWNWFIDPGLKDYAFDFVNNYDMDGDGRLNPRELILAIINHNRNSIGSGTCKNCFNEIAKKLDAMFIFLDCNNDGALSAEDLWNNLPKLVRPDNRWNIFGFNNNDNIRTSAVNDFCLKNGNAKDGSVTKDEFRTGILLGYWDRQTSTTSIVKDDSRNLKHLRWDEGGMTDTVAFRYYKEKVLAEMIAKSGK